MQISVWWSPFFFFIGMLVGLFYNAMLRMAARTSQENARSDAEADTMLDREGR